MARDSDQIILLDNEDCPHTHQAYLNVFTCLAEDGDVLTSTQQCWRKRKITWKSISSKK